MKKKYIYLLIVLAIAIPLIPTAYSFWRSGAFDLVNQKFGPIFWVGVIVFIVFILGIVFFATKQAKKAIQPKTLANGLPATATVIRSYQGNMKISMGGVNQNYQLIIEVNVTNPQGETWQATMKEMINITQISVFQPGVSFAVKYDPTNKSKVVIDQSTQTQQKPNQASNINKAMNNPNAGYTNQDVLNARQAAPADIMQKVQQHSDLLKELMTSGAASTAKVVKTEIELKDFMPGINILKIKITVAGTIIDEFESDIYLLTPVTSMYKFDPDKTVYILYDKKNPRRVCISGTDKANNTIEI